MEKTVGGLTYYGFQGPSSAYLACGITKPTDKDMPSDASKAAVGCRFLTGGFSTGANPDTLEITYDSAVLPNVHQASGELIDIDGDEAWRVEAKDVSGTTLGHIDLGPSGNITGNCPAASGTVTGDGISTKWCFDLPPSANPIKKITVSFTGSSQLHNVGFAFDNFNASATGDSTTLPADPCCPPWNTDMLEEMMVYQGTGGIGDDYTLKFQPTSAFNTALEAYVAYLHALNPAINTIHIHFNLHDAGAGSIPTGGPLMPPEHWEAWDSISGPSPPPSFFSQPLHVNHWYRVHTGIYLNDNLTFFSDSCANNDIYVRIQVQGKHGGYTGVLQMRTKDGRVIEKKIAPGTTSKQPLNVSIEKKHSPSRFSTGSKGAFSIKVQNQGNVLAKDMLRVVDHMPGGLSVKTGAFRTGSWSCKGGMVTSSGQDVACAYNRALGKHSRATLRLNVRVAPKGRFPAGVNEVENCATASVQGAAGVVAAGPKVCDKVKIRHRKSIGLFDLPIGIGIGGGGGATAPVRKTPGAVR